MQKALNLTKFKLPAILCDIDGVLYRGKKAIPRSKQALKCILSEHEHPQSKIKFCLPFNLLTNGGGILESDRAKVVNKVMFDVHDSFEPRV